MAIITVEHNKRIYCERHGYDLHVKTGWFKYQNIGFEKIFSVLELLKTNKYEWVFWCGSDTMITNQTIKLETFVDEGFHFIVSKDVWDINADVFLARNSLECKTFLQRVLDEHDNFVDLYGNPKPSGETLPDGGRKDWSEQGAIIKLLQEYEGIIKILPQKSFNAYLYHLYTSPWHQKGMDANGNDGRWGEGDFLVHWPGLPYTTRVQLAVQFIKLVKE